MGGRMFANGTGKLSAIMPAGPSSALQPCEGRAITTAVGMVKRMFAGQSIAQTMRSDVALAVVAPVGFVIASQREGCVTRIERQVPWRPAVRQHEERIHTC